MGTQISNRRLLELLAVSLLVVGSAVAGMGTYAYLSNTETSSSNTVTGGSLDLTLDGNNGDVSTSFSLTGAAPGETTKHTYDLRNVGPVDADHVEVSITTSENDNGLTEPSDSDLDTELNNVATQKHIKVVTYEYQNDGGTTLNNIRSSVSDDNGNGIVDLAEVINQTGTTDDLVPPQPNSGNTTKLVIELEVANSDGSYTGSDEEMMADGVDVKVDVTLNQDSSQ